MPNQGLIGIPNAQKKAIYYNVQHNNIMKLKYIINILYFYIIEIQYICFVFQFQKNKRNPEVLIAGINAVILPETC